MTFNRLNFDIEDYLDEVLQRLDEIGSTQTALAREARISASQLSRWLSGMTEPRVSSLKPVEAALCRLEENFRIDRAAEAIDENGR